MIVQTIGSFATLWFLLWIFCALLLLSSYPLLRKILFKLHPEYASGLLLTITSIPMLFSLLCVTLLFFPSAESLFVGEHCHQGCETHIPELATPQLVIPGLIMLGVFLVYFSFKVFQQVRHALLLKSQFNLLSQTPANTSYKTLAHQTPLVFTVGWWRNDVYISEGLKRACTAREIDTILAHERAHIIRKDNLRMVFARLTTLLLPRRFTHKLIEDLQLLTESACDFYAAKTFNNTDVAQVFVKVQRIMPRVDTLPYGVSSINGSVIEQRVTALLAQSTLYQPRRWITIVLAIFSVMVLIMAIDPLHHIAEMYI